jgi:hypothetical protein
MAGCATVNASRSSAWEWGCSHVIGDGVFFTILQHVRCAKGFCGSRFSAYARMTDLLAKARLLAGHHPAASPWEAAIAFRYWLYPY